MALIPHDYVHTYVHSYVSVLTEEKKKYHGFFEGFSNHNSIYLSNCVEILEEGPSIEESVTKQLGIYFISVFKITQFLSHKSLPDIAKQTEENGKCLRARQICRPGRCESINQRRSPLGGYIGPNRRLQGHVQNEPLCNCKLPAFTFGRYSKIPIPMATRTYLSNHFDFYNG